MKDDTKLLIRIQELFNAFGDQGNQLDESSRRMLFQVAEAYNAGKPLIVSDLAKNTDYGTAPTVYGRLKKLLDSGLIQNRQSPEDGRAIQLLPTPKAQKQLKELGLKVRKARSV